ncbi:Hypothetical protein A7982_01215 [Minicystis rosea]|nr:Hypothetical protein A7982_01215 [Minicystis rosea]
MIAPRLLALSMLLAPALGCSHAHFWHLPSICRERPSAYDTLPSWSASLLAPHDETILFREGRADTPMAVELTRRACLYHVEARPGGERARFGPYLYVPYELVSAPGRARWALVATAPSGESRLIVDGVERAVEGSIYKARFSRDGEHFAYSAFDGKAYTVVVDGKVVGPTRGARSAVLRDVLDDGRAWFSEQTTDGRDRMVLGSWVSQPFDRVGPWDVRRDGRFMGVLSRGAQFEIVIDGRSKWPQGEVLTIARSPDGARSGYLLRRDGRVEAVVDGIPLEVPDRPGAESWIDLGFASGLAYVAWYPTGDRNTYTIAGAPTPAAPPSVGPMPPGRQGTRVQIGASFGPKFEAVAPETLVRDAEGRVHYEGWYDGRKYYVVDNVIQEPRR